MRARWLRLAVVVACFALAACRGCEDGERGDGGATGPAMPSGMLMGAEGGSSERAGDAGAAGAAGATAASGVRVARGVKGGAWAEVQVARAGDAPDRKDFGRWRDDSLFVSLEAMTLLHEAFARALPAFDLFLPRLFTPDALAKLATELAAFEAAAGPLADAARDLAKTASDAAAKKQSLWVLGPP